MFNKYDKIDHVKKFAELFLYYLDANSLMIELCSVIGIDNAIKVMEIFGGTTIAVPSMKTLKKAYRDVDIYLTLTNNSSSEVKSFLSKKYNLQIKSIEVLFREIRRILTQDNIIKDYLKRVGLEKDVDNFNMNIDEILLSELDSKPDVVKDKPYMKAEYDETSANPVLEETVLEDTEDVRADEIQEESSSYINAPIVIQEELDFSPVEEKEENFNPDIIIKEEDTND